MLLILKALQHKPWKHVELMNVAWLQAAVPSVFQNVANHRRFLLILVEINWFVTIFRHVQLLSHYRKLMGRTWCELEADRHLVNAWTLAPVWLTWRSWLLLMPKHLCWELWSKSFPDSIHAMGDVSLRQSHDSMIVFILDCSHCNFFFFKLEIAKRNKRHSVGDCMRGWHQELPERRWWVSVCLAMFQWRGDGVCFILSSLWAASTSKQAHGRSDISSDCEIQSNGITYFQHLPPWQEPQTILWYAVLLASVGGSVGWLLWACAGWTSAPCPVSPPFFELPAKFYFYPPLSTCGFPERCTMWRHWHAWARFPRLTS